MTFWLVQKQGGSGAGGGQNVRLKCVNSEDVNTFSLKPQLPEHLLSSPTFYGRRSTEPKRNDT